MSYVEKYFGKPAGELTYEDIVNFFAIEREESDKIEFKSYYYTAETNKSKEKEKEDGIIRSICAFLNSSGGIVVWGAPNGKRVEGRTEKIFMGELSPLKHKVEKDYFINRITDSITSAPNAVLFHAFEKNGDFVYVMGTEGKCLGQSRLRSI